MNRRKIILSILSFMYSSFIIVGTSFFISNSFKFFYDYLIFNIIGYVLLYLIFYIVLDIFFKIFYSIQISLICNKIKKLISCIMKHPIIFSMIFMLLCWLPYIIIFYPGVLSPDPSFQIRQFFGIPNKYSTYSVMLDPSVTITNHHPVVHTLILGFCVKIGKAIGSVNLGLFIYTFSQIILLAFTLACTINFLRKEKVKDKYLLIMLLVYSLVPIFSMYSVAILKDVVFTCFVLFYIMYLYKFSKNDDLGIKDIILFILVSICMILFRNNGIHVLLLSFPFLFLLKKKKKLKLLVVFAILLSFNFTYSKVLLPYFKITPSNIRETLSIPFQQTARVAKEHNDATPHEREVIDKILEYDTLKDRYNPDLSDPVKNNFNKYATNKDLSKYFKVWIDQGLRHPKTYIEATISNTYGYFFPLKNGKYLYYSFDKRIVRDGYYYHFISPSAVRDIVSYFGLAFQYIPLTNIAFNTWTLLFMAAFLLYKKKYGSIIYLLPSFVLLLVCFASPVNGYFRYTMPFVFGLMLNFGLFLKENK